MGAACSNSQVFCGLKYLVAQLYAFFEYMWEQLRQLHATIHTTLTLLMTLTFQHNRLALIKEIEEN